MRDASAGRAPDSNGPEPPGRAVPGDGCGGEGQPTGRPASAPAPQLGEAPYSSMRTPIVPA